VDHGADVGERLPGGNLGGAWRIGDTVRRATGAWSPTVHALLRHLESRGFPAPRFLGIDAHGREVLTYLDGDTVGTAQPWPDWAYAEGSLVAVAQWIRGYHDAVADFVPPAAARWRMSDRAWRPGLIVAHNDLAPYNAVWGSGGLTGFIDWDLASPAEPGWDLAFAAFSWVPLHARRVVAAEGFADFGSRPRRLRQFLDAYGNGIDRPGFIDLVRARVQDSVDGLHRLAAAGDADASRLVAEGAASDMVEALEELQALTPELSTALR
jgi:aminoglycoside phosphotransferase (APT) family kinase protein